jgi:hypothetical protein
MELGLNWSPTYCQACDYPAGTVAYDNSHDSAVFRFEKHALAASGVSSPSLEQYVSLRLLEASQAHAAHRFVIQDGESGLRLLVRPFNDFGASLHDASYGSLTLQ